MKQVILTGLLVFQAGCAAESPNYLDFSGSSPSIGLTDYRTVAKAPVVAVPAAVPAAALENTDWQLSRFLDAPGREQPVLAGTAISARFAGGRLTGHAGCNSYFGDYRITAEGRLLLTSPIGATKKGCRLDISKQEHAYLNRLAQAVYYQQDGQALTLLNQNQQPLLEFQATAQPAPAPTTAATLENTTWQTEIAAASPETTPAGQNANVATARFENGQLFGKAGCNQFSAPYTVNGQQLSIGPLRSSQMACAAAGVMGLEARYLQSFTYVRSYKISGGLLRLLDNNGLVVLGFTRQ